MLTALALASLAGASLQPEAAPDTPPVVKPLVILVALTAGVIGIDVAGFGPAVLLLLMFLFAAVERLPIIRSTLVAAGTTAALILIFRIWLGVPLPAGLFGF